MSSVVGWSSNVDDGRHFDKATAELIFGQAERLGYVNLFSEFIDVCKELCGDRTRVLTDSK